MKPRNLLPMILVLLLGLAVPALAVTIHSPLKAKAGHHEENLCHILDTWGLPVDAQLLQHATPLESLPAGTYSIGHYALDLGKPEHRGIYHWSLMSRGRSLLASADAFNWVIPKKPGNWEGNITFTETSDFGFFEAKQKKALLLTAQHQHPASKHHHWSSGLIFDLAEINPLYAGEYLIAFEAAKNRRHFESLDGNSLVIQVQRLDDVSQVPLPGTLPLGGSGLLCLAIRWFYQRRFASGG